MYVEQFRRASEEGSSAFWWSQGVRISGNLFLSSPRMKENRIHNIVGSFNTSPNWIKLILAEYNAGAQTGVCYGMIGNNLPSQQEVVDLYKSNNIQRMRLYYPDQGALQALSGSNIELMLGVSNDDLQGIASSTSTANDWVQTNVAQYSSTVKFRYIAISNEVSPVNGNSQYVNYVLTAMQNIQSAISAAGLQITVSTSVDFGLLGTPYPPSQGAFRSDVSSYIDPIISFLAENGAPLLANVYPYFSYKDNTGSISLSYALFTSSSVVVTDPYSNLGYQNLFDAMMDALYSGLDKAGGSSVGIVVSESGWPTTGGTTTTVANAETYNNNLIQHVKNGTPMKSGRPGYLETYAFAMFDENEKNPELEKHWGFTPDKQPTYQFSFS
ncbi:glucan endo-1,3-beta-glucosidase-like [Macadamia integrifolia]|uniref:glucan endo-1,3-beta-glucosidase-like n=1 Tax=Macadamia integrifolia TaxID=60698 RepID=UPI001C4F39EC|nr:glucan endo-1,3-beta-glucosidase-like [Macadamia integrifolia]